MCECANLLTDGRLESSPVQHVSAGCCADDVFPTGVNFLFAKSTTHLKKVCQSEQNRTARELLQCYKRHVGG